jgi:signal transduction histidine kinase
MAPIGGLAPVGRRYARLGLGVLALAAGVATLAIARHDAEESFGGRSVGDGILELAAGWSLVLAGLVWWARHPRRGFGPLLTAAGLAWFLPEWSSPAVGSSLVFTVGLVGIGLCAPLVASAALAYPRSGARSSLERAALAVAFGGAALLGPLSATVFDPVAQACFQCPANLVLLHGDGDMFDAAVRWGLRIELAAAVTLMALIAWRVASAAAPRVVTAPVLLPAAAYLGLVALELHHSMPGNVLATNPFDVRIWRYEAVTLVTLAGGVAWGVYSSLRARASVARLVVELAQSYASGGARDVLARELGDPGLRLAFRRPASDNYVDSDGRVVDVAPGPGRAVTPLVQAGRPVAALVHDPARLRDADRVDEVVTGARLALENERFHAEIRAQLEELRAARVRIVAAGDLERRRLERDLHDGAQQRLVAVALALGMLRALSTDASPRLKRRLDRVDAELHATIAELRDVATGIFPAMLTDAGLAAAIEMLADGSAGTIDIRRMPRDRLDPALEAAAYFVVAETLRRTHATRAAIEVSRIDGDLVVDLDTDAGTDESLADLEDRVGALDGRLTVQRDADGLHLHAELPCG